MSDAATKLGFPQTGSMAVGGMIGGGIFSTLGVVIGIAGHVLTNPVYAFTFGPHLGHVVGLGPWILRR